MNDLERIAKMSTYPIADSLSRVSELKLPLRLMYIPGYEGACICEAGDDMPIAVGDPQVLRLAMDLMNAALHLRIAAQSAEAPPT